MVRARLPRCAHSCAGSFQQTTAGIRNLLASGAVVATNTVVCRANLEQLAAIMHLTATLGVRWVTLSHMQNHRRRQQERRALGRQVGPSVAAHARGSPDWRALRHLRRSRGSPLLSSTGRRAPRGRGRPFGDRQQVAQRFDYAQATVPAVSSMYAMRLRGRLPGTSEGYAQRFSDAELRPVAGRRLTRRPFCPAAALVETQSSASKGASRRLGSVTAEPGVGGRPAP